MFQLRIDTTHKTLRPFFASFLLIACMQGASLAQQNIQNLTKVTPTEQTLTGMVEQFTQAQVGYNPAVLSDLTAPEYIEVSPLGEVDPREKMLGFYAPEHKDSNAPKAEVSEINVRVLDRFAIILAKITFLPKSGDTRPIGHSLRETFVARPTPEGWKFISAQYTTIYSHS